MVLMKTIKWGTVTHLYTLQERQIGIWKCVTGSINPIVFLSQEKWKVDRTIGISRLNNVLVRVSMTPKSTKQRLFFFPSNGNLRKMWIEMNGIIPFMSKCDRQHNINQTAYKLNFVIICLRIQLLICIPNNRFLLLFQRHILLI